MRHTNAFAIFREEISGFALKLSRIIELLEHTVDQGELPLVEALKEGAILAHRLKGASGFFGLVELAQLGAQLEKILLRAINDHSSPLSHAELKRQHAALLFEISKLEP